MIIKKITILTILSINTLTISMNNKTAEKGIINFFGLDTNCVTYMPKEIQKQIRFYISEKKEWWYSYKKFIHDNPISEACFDCAGNRLATLSAKSLLSIFDLKSNTKPISLISYKSVESISFDSEGNLLAAGSDENNIYIFNVNSYKQLISFPHNGMPDPVDFRTTENILESEADNYKIHISDKTTQEVLVTLPHNEIIHVACFDPWKKYLAIGSWDNNMHTFTTRIFTQHDACTLEQIMLKKIFHSWLLIEKPRKKIKTLNAFLTDIAHKFQLKKKDLSITLKTFPEPMQSALWRTMHKNIRCYGKKEITNISLLKS